MTATFSSAESASLEREVQLETHTAELSDIWTPERLDECQLWINSNNYKKVLILCSTFRTIIHKSVELQICLQFPDSLLEFSAHIAKQLKRAVGEAEVFILGDTSYGSCCVDEVIF